MRQVGTNLIEVGILLGGGSWATKPRTHLALSRRVGPAWGIRRPKRWPPHPRWDLPLAAPRKLGTHEPVKQLEIRGPPNLPGDPTWWCGQHQCLAAAWTREQDAHPETLQCAVPARQTTRPRRKAPNRHPTLDNSATSRCSHPSRNPLAPGHAHFHRLRLDTSECKSTWATVRREL